MVPDVDLAEVAWTTAVRFSRRSATGFRHAKRLLGEFSIHGYVEHLRAEAEAIHACAASADSAEGIRAFLAKEEPNFMDPYPSLVAADHN